MLNRTICIVLLLGSTAQAISQDFRYRGTLEELGQPAEGRYDLRLGLYAEAESAIPLVAPVELTGVDVMDGRFDVALDFGDLPTGIDAGWLEVAVKAPDATDWWTLEGRSQVQLAGQLCPESWTLAGNLDTNATVNFLGTVDAEPLELRVANVRVARYEPKAIFSAPPRTANVIAGSFINAVGEDVRGATIAGGGANGDSGVSNAEANRVDANFGTVGGGVSNRAIGVATTVAGGDGNVAVGSRSAVAGGTDNTASGGNSFIPGGVENCAGGDLSFAAGFRAKVRPGNSAPDAGRGCVGVDHSGTPSGHQGTFVWADFSSLDPYVSAQPNQFLVRAANGMVISAGGVNSAGGSRLRVDGTLRVDVLGSGGDLPLCYNSTTRTLSVCVSPDPAHGGKDVDLRAELEGQRIEIAALREELAVLRAMLEVALREGGG